jgi:hypothetical protein
MSSISQAGYHKVKFKDEKLWIPWRIIDFRKKFVNFTDKIYPVIYIKKGEKNNSKDSFTFKTDSINYKLCNETNFTQRGENHYIDVALDEIYCIEFDDLELGGGWTADFLNYLQLDIYICKDGVEYKENNDKCTKFQNLKDKYLQNDSWAFEYFYPIVEYQPTNYENPILVIYKNHFYNFSTQLNKEERIYIQEYVLNDDKGLIFNDDKNSSFWGYFSSDFDVLYSSGDLLNSKLSSKLYSLSIYLDAGKILYMRRYNKIYTVIANVFPIFNVVFFLFDTLTYMIKTIMTEKYLSELFFQRIDDNNKINVEKGKRKSAGFFYHKLNLSKKESNKKNMFNNIKEKEEAYYERGKNNNNEFSIKSNENNKVENNGNNFSNNSNKNNMEEENNNINNVNCSNKTYKLSKRKKNQEINTSKNSSKDTNTNKSNLEKFNNKLKNLVSNRNTPHLNNNNNNSSSFYPFNSPKHNNYVEINLKNSKNESIKNKLKEKKSQILNNNDINHENNKNVNKTGYDDKNNELNNISNYSHFNFYKNRGLNNSAIITRFRLKGSLFKMKDYIYSFFIKAIRKEYKYISKEFTAIFNFLSDVYDISSYLQLYRQFHILSGFLLDNVANIDLNHKININNKELFEQIALKNKNIFYFALKEQFMHIPDK